MLQAVARPGSLAEAHSILASRDGAVIIAGGTVVMPILNYGTDAFDTLVSLRGSGLSGISIDAGKATIGAMTTLSELQEKEALGFLWQALDAIASPTVRNMATVGGNLFVKQPYGDLAACLIALGATASISGPSGERERTGREASSPPRSAAARSSPASPSRCRRPALSNSARRRARRSILRRSSPSRRSFR